MIRALWLTFATVSGALLPGDVQGVSNPAALHGTAGDVVRGVTDVTDLLALPVLLVAASALVGVAILRYRLYDIDVVIRRTLIYAAPTVTLGATYLALVLIIGLAVGRSGFAVAVSTLAVAALFRPARAVVSERVQPAHVSLRLRGEA